jgi:hypothetical protein
VLCYCSTLSGSRVATDLPIQAVADQLNLPFGGNVIGRLAGIVFIVLMVWIAVTVYDKGIDQAFGGLFAGFVEPTAIDAPAHRSTPDRAMDAFQRAYNKSEERVERLLREQRSEE